jgi:RsiW-degrading membrane proteinase PrsW (M82 family)
MELLAIALAPGIGIIWFIYFKDKYDKEPLRALAKSFFLGMLATIPALILQLGAVKLLNSFVIAEGWTYYILLAFVVVALTEEACKFAMVRIYAFPRIFFNEPFDGITYGVMVAMGFATLENFAYIYQYGMDAAVSRMFLSVPAHGTFGVLMGYYVGLAKFTHNSHSKQLMVRGLLLAVFFHGIFDLFLFVQQDVTITKSFSSSFLLAIALLSYAVAIRLSWEAIKMHQDISKKNFDSSDHIV